MSEKKLTPKQRKFVEAYMGNATEAARLAGYSGDENALGVMGNKLLRIVKITEEIRKRETKETSKLIATREDRQKFWTETMYSPEFDLAYRLKASELLGRSQADFKDKVEHSFSEALADKLTNARRRKLTE